MEFELTTTEIEKVGPVLCAAIYIPTEGRTPVHHVKNEDLPGVVLCGWRHAHIIGQHLVLTGTRLPSESIQGFITKKNWFLTREEAKQVADHYKQVIRDGDLKQLYSESIY